MTCPECGREMFLMLGSGWDNDRWLCVERDPRTLALCPGEIELETSTCPEEVEHADQKD